MTQVYLVPGFFGFTELGGLNYFHRVSEVLEEALAERGVDARIIETETMPSGSIRRRARRLLKTVVEEGGHREGELHFVGHSTGGLDVRMLLTPGVHFYGTEREEVAVAKRTRTAITLSTPHHGTPLANFFTGVNGRYLLYLLTLLATSAAGRYATYLGAKWLSLYAHLDEYFGQRGNILDSLSESVLRRITPKKGDKLWDYIREISSDQGAVVQLTPEAMDVFNAAVSDRKDVNYYSFVSASPPPNLRGMAISPRNLYKPVTHAIYAAVYSITSREHRHYPYPLPEEELRAEIEDNLSIPLDSTTNDGVVPAMSQVWGKLGGAVMGDHLDVVGQFTQKKDGREYAEWLHSGAKFGEKEFRKLWSRVADVIASENKR